jgi:hypothetical protein
MTQAFGESCAVDKARLKVEQMIDHSLINISHFPSPLPICHEQRMTRVKVVSSFYASRPTFMQWRELVDDNR